MDGEPRTVVIEVGPITHHGATKSQVRRSEQNLKKDLDALVRQYLGVGLRNPVVKSTMDS